MSHLQGVKPEDLPEALKPVLDLTEKAMGFVPNSFLAMAHWPELLQQFSALAGTVLAGGVLPRQLKQLIAFVVSNAAGCRYCQAHTSHGAEKAGVDADKIEAAFEFETSELFSEAERAALRVALHAGMVPNAVEAAHFTALSEHYSAREITEIVAVISLFGFLNRWNDTLATTLEPSPVAFASAHLSAHGWDADKHA